MAGGHRDVVEEAEAHRGGASAWWPGGRRPQNPALASPARSASTIAHAAPAAWRAASKEPALEGVSASNMPPPPRLIARTDSTWCSGCTAPSTPGSTAGACRTSQPPKFTVDECKEKDMTYAAPIFVRARFMNASTGEIKEQTVFMGDFPMMTDKGTFIINGTERVVVSQLVRSPGVIFQPGRDAKTFVTGTIHPYRGEWIEFDVETKPGKDITAGTRVARKRRLSLFVLLRALGYEDEAFLGRFVKHFDFLEGQWEKERELAPTRDEALVEIYKRARPGEPPSVESAKAYFENAFFNPKRYDLTRVGRYKLSRKLGPEVERIAELLDIPLERPAPGQGVLSASEMLAAATYMLHWAKGESGYKLDDQDHFANRRIRSVGELIQNQVRVGPLPHGAGRPRTHDHPGRRGHHAANAHQHPSRGRGDQGVLRNQPAVAVHGPGEPAVWAHPQAPAVGARARRPVP